MQSFKGLTSLSLTLVATNLSLPEPTMKTQRDRDTAIPRDARKRDPDDTEGTQELPPLAACVNTLPVAVQLATSQEALAGGADPVFVFARALKAFEVTTGQKLSRPDLDGAFSLWWATAEKILAGGSNRDECRLLLLGGFKKVRAPLGSNPLAEAIRRAAAGPAPAEAARYSSSAPLQRLVAVCFHLQHLDGDAPFFLSARDAASILGRAGNAHHGLAMLNGLVDDGLLILACKGTPGGRRASRYRFTSLARPAQPG